MLEDNVFRVMMMVGGIVFAGALATFLFLTPIMVVTPDEKVMYEKVMQVDLPDDRDKLTPIEALQFSLKGKVRGNVRHY